MSEARPFRLARAPEGDPYFNQAYEERLMGTDAALPLLMLWHNPPAVVCGKHQNLFGEVNVWRAWQAGLPLVRRESGGGTVTHGPGNLNYTMLLPLTGSWKASDLVHPVITALNTLGVEARLFDSAGIAIDGLKVSGSAQRVTGGRILHHGTLLFDARLHQVDSPLERSGHISNCRATRSKPAPIGNIRPFLKEDMDLAAFEAHLIRRLCGDEAPFELKTRAETEKLAREKYETWDWTFARSPRFDYQKAFDYQGRPWQLSYHCEKGTLSQVSLVIDGQEKLELAALFIGQRLEPAALLTHTCQFFSQEQALALLPHFFG